MTGEQKEPPPYSTSVLRILRLPDGEEADDRLAVEEPLELRIGGEPVAVTMRTPGHDEELALGFALSEGLRPVSARVPDDLAANTIELEAPGFDPGSCSAARSTRPPRAASAARARSRRSPSSRAPVESTADHRGGLVKSLPETLRAAQATFASTGGLHATGLFTPDGGLVCAREDVGRHNAMDKVIGRAFLDGLLPLSRPRPLRQRPALVRARAEGRGRGLSRPRRRRLAVVARRRPRGRPRHHPVRLRAGRPGQCLLAPERITA